MPTKFRFGRGGSSFSKPMVVATLLVAAALVLGVAQIKSASIERAYRHTKYAAASVVSVGKSGIADVRYDLDGKSRNGQLNVSTAQSIDRGDRLAVRVSEVGGRLQVETPFYGAVYRWTATALAAIAATVAAIWWRSSAGITRRQRKPWLPGELARLHRKRPAG